MRFKLAATRADIVVASGCILFVLIILGGSGSCERKKASEVAMRAVCMSHLKQLWLAWGVYADDHEGKLVNAMAGKDREQDGVVSEKAWVGKDWGEGYRNGAKLAEQKQVEAIEAIAAGALFPYLQAESIYRCPKGEEGQMRTYSIVDSMNGVDRDRTKEDGVWINDRGNVRKPNLRLVFVDVGWAMPESFAVHYDKEQWWALPPVRHIRGTTLSFADGHAEYWRWKAGETVKLGESTGGGSSDENTVPQTAEGKEDLHRFQKGVWGKLGYTPSG